MFVKLVQQPTDSTFDSLVSDLFGDRGSSPSLQRAADIPVNIQEHSDRYEIAAEVPGVKKEDLRITVENGILAISGQRAPVVEGAKAKVLHSEISTGRFARSFVIPRDVDAAKLDAHLSGGILTLTLPKSEAALPREISVK
jgi:HSP20 family protein